MRAERGDSVPQRRKVSFRGDRICAGPGAPAQILRGGRGGRSQHRRGDPGGPGALGAGGPDGPGAAEYQSGRPRDRSQCRRSRRGGRMGGVPRCRRRVAAGRPPGAMGSRGGAGREWIGADFQEWNENGSLEATGHYHKDDFVGRILASAYRSGRALRLERPISHFLRSSLTWTGTVIVKWALVRQVGGFHPALRGPEDLHLWYRLALRSELLLRSAGGRAVPAARGKPHRRGPAGRMVAGRVGYPLPSAPAAPGVQIVAPSPQREGLQRE
jgi:hypothetical protein